jgi:uncharacterized membrane protein
MSASTVVASALHVLSVVIWVGGMFFAYMALRPVAASLLAPPERLTLWAGVFGRFFPWVWAAVGVILVTGLWLIVGVFGGMASASLYVHLMFGLGVVMMALFLFVFFAPYQGLKSAVAAGDWPRGARHLAMIRRIVGINTLLGVIVVGVAYSKIAS